MTKAHRKNDNMQRDNDKGTERQWQRHRETMTKAQRTMKKAQWDNDKERETKVI